MSFDDIDNTQNFDGTDSSAHSLPVLEHRLKELRERLAHRQRSAQIKRWLYLSVGILLLLVSGFSLFTLTSMALELDTHARRVAFPAS